MEYSIPPRLMSFTKQQILDTLTAHKKKSKNQPFTNPTSMFGRAAKFLTKQESSIQERLYLHTLWNSANQSQVPCVPNINVIQKKKNAHQKQASTPQQQNPTIEAECFYIIHKHLKKQNDKVISEPKKQNQHHNPLKSSTSTNTSQTSKRKTRSPTKPGIFKRLKTKLTKPTKNITLSLNSLHISASHQIHSAQQNCASNNQNISQPQNTHCTPPRSGSSSSQSDNEDLNNNDPALLQIIQKMNHKINRFPTYTCPVCTRFVYDDRFSVRNMTFGDDGITRLREKGFNVYQKGQTIRICRRCFDTFQRKQIPSMAYFNNMQVPESPPEIACLTDIEAKFISQVRPFMKIFFLSRGQGQQALKGSAIHFPQSVDEIIETLPLNKDSSDLMLIKETNNNNTQRNFEIRPKVLYEALNCLKRINPLYSNINIQHVADEDLVIHSIVTNPVTTNINHHHDDNTKTGFNIINSYVSILRGTIHQQSPDLSPNINKSNTMSIVAIAYSKMQECDTWSSVDINNVLAAGYTYFKTLSPDNTLIPVLADISGSIKCFDNVSVTCNLQFQDTIQGYLNQVPGTTLHRLQQTIVEFIESKYQYTLVIINNQCLALIKIETNLFLFDSFSRGPRGKKSDKGTACIVKCNQELAAQFLSEHIHRNCTPFQYKSNLAPQQKECFRYTFLPVTITDDALNQPHATTLTPCISNNRATFTYVSEQYDILRASMHQASSEFINGGLQCCAMAASAAAHSIFWTPSHWDQDLMDNILRSGDQLYTTIVPTRDEMLDSFQLQRQIITCYRNAQLGCRVANDTYFGGSLDNLPDVPGENINRLHTSIAEFLQHPDYTNAILTANGYCFALLKCDSKLYLFDSHSRGPKGLHHDDGTACLIRFNQDQAPVHASVLIHRLCASSLAYLPNMTEMQRNQFAYVIRPVNFQQLRQPELVLDNEPPNYDPHVSSNAQNFQGQPQHQEDDEPNKTDTHIPTHHKSLLLDCVVRSDQPDDPTLSSFVEGLRTKTNPHPEVTLQRQKGQPLYPAKEKRLEELCFIKAFPFGRFGLEEQRNIKITPLDYFQTRIMSNNPNFHTTEYLFYALSRVEAYIIHQKISVCGNMTTNNGVHENNQEDFTLPGLENIHLYMSGIRGSGSYWKTYTGDVLAMIQQLGPPSFFLTFSYDDLNSIDSLTALWIGKYGPNAQIPSDLSQLSYEQRRQLLNDYPVNSARHFNNRMNAILNILLTDGEEIFGLKVTDFTYRVEFQGRGSPHVHMIIWLQNQPDWNTKEGVQLIERNVSCSLTVPYRQLVMRYQNHTHRSTCFKKHNNCRFGFPRKASATTVILGEDEIAKQHGRFIEIKRNASEKMINNYHPKLLQIINCNMDIQPVTGTRAIAFYIGKYMSKGEPTYLRQEIRDIINNFKADNRSSYYQKSLKIANVIIKHREISAQECAFRLLHLRLRHSSRSFVFVPTYKPENRLRLVRRETMFTGQPQMGLNIIERYMLRPQKLGLLCLLEFAAWWHAKPNKNQNDPDRDLSEHEEEEQEVNINKPEKLKQNKGYIIKRKRSAIVKYPRFKPVDQTEEYLYSMILLHLPFEEENFHQAYVSIRDAFDELRQHFRTNENDSINNPGQADIINNILHQLEEVPQDDGDEIEHGPNHNVFEEDDIPLREHEIFMPVINTDIPLHERVRTMTPEQRQLYERVRTQIVNGNQSQMLLFVQGSGGTGKSYSLQIITELITTLCPGGSKAIIKAAPTGVAARNINAVTIHRAFSLGVELHSVAQYMKLGGRILHERRVLYNQVLFIIIDEISMVSYEVFRQIHLRCTEIFGNDAPFGGINVILSGDILQLCPCRGKNIYEMPAYLSHEQNLWRLFEFLQLRVVMRQQEGNHYLNTLNKLRIGTLTKADVTNLRQRILDPLNPSYSEMVATSKESLHLYPTVKQVDDYNEAALKDIRSAGTKVYTMQSRDTYGSGIKFGQPVPDELIFKDYRKCAGISTVLNMAIGCKVMLKVNIEPLGGLCNGSIGVLRKLVWTALRRDQREPGDLPEYAYVEFEGMIAERHLVREPGFERCTLIRPRTFEFTGKRGIKVMRYQLPLVLCFSCSIHKSQGMSLDLCTIYCGKRIFKQGMLYVALSRVRTFEGLFITEIDDKKLLVNKRGAGPANEKAMRELQRLVLCTYLDILYDETNKSLIDSLVSFRVEYVMCRICNWWICDCLCK